jgi:hypothetical protein
MFAQIFLLCTNCRLQIQPKFKRTKQCQVLLQKAWGEEGEYVLHGWLFNVYVDELILILDGRVVVDVTCVVCVAGCIQCTQMVYCYC